MNVKQIGASFVHALRGLTYVFKNEQNFRIQLLIAAVAVGALLYFPLFTWERVLIIILIVMVLTMELMNSALERFTDLLKPRLNSYVGAIKDIMAAAVLLTSVGAAVIGWLILWPHLLLWFR
jgi:diacylglycerol kinase